MQVRSHDHMPHVEPQYVRFCCEQPISGMNTLLHIVSDGQAGSCRPNGARESRGDGMQLQHDERHREHGADNKRRLNSINHVYILSRYAITVILNPNSSLLLNTRVPSNVCFKAVDFVLSTQLGVRYI